MDSIYKRYIPATMPVGGDDDCAWMFIFNDNKMLVRADSAQDGIPSLGDVLKLEPALINKQYMGKVAGSPCYCMEAGEGFQPPAGMEFRELRALLGKLDEDIFLLAGRAFQLVNWNRLTRFCGKCAAPTEIKQNELAKQCPACGAVYYPRISPAVIVAVVRDDKILLAHNKNFRASWYSVIAGFVEPGETFEDCVKREVAEEVGLRVTNIRYFGSQPWPFPDSLMVGFIAEYESGDIMVDGDEIDAAAWYGKDNLPPCPGGNTIAGQLIEAVLS
ncbi:NAD(+) diphosphatase [Sporomusa aerivorans]|uniref:NAD(+) diphosphatase n=1 Tax=Sporomusa aerivorans TaxID=204936 RepID=UPI00352B7B28